MKSPGSLASKNGKMMRESTTSRTQDETDHDDDDASVGNQSLADQARRNWMKKDAQLQSNRSIMTEQPPRTTQSPGHFKAKKTMSPLGGSARWTASTAAASVTNSLKAPMSWHGGKGKLSPSRFSANFTPPISRRKNSVDGSSSDSPKMPSKSPSPKTSETRKSVGNFIRGSKIYKIETPFNAIKSFVPMTTASDSSVKSNTSKASRWSTATKDTKTSVEPLPDRWASKKRAEKEIPLSAPVEEEEDYDEEYEEEEVDINDPGQEAEEEAPVKFDEDDRRAKFRKFAVDRVPRAMFTSRNVQNFPIWPPIIKVRGFQAARSGEVSAVSIGSGFSDDEYLTDDFSSDEEASFEETAKALPPAQRTSYRIRYDGPTKLNLDVYKQDSRFASTVELEQPDGAPNLPSRNMDLTPGMPPRRRESGSDLEGSASEYSEELLGSREFAPEPERKRPDVWITALSGDKEEDVIWNVRRVWDIEKEDMGEREISVHSQQLFSQIRSLVGAADDDSLGASERSSFTQKSDVKPKLPSRSWQVQKVVETKGRLLDLEDEKQLDDADMVRDIKVMNSVAVVELKDNIKAQEELVRKITERRVEKKEKREKGFVEPEVEDTEEAAPPLTKEEMDRWSSWFVPGDEHSIEGSQSSEEEQEEEKDDDVTPPQTPKRAISGSLHSQDSSIVSTKVFETKEPALVEEDNQEMADPSLPEEDETPSTAKVEKASETASVNTSSMDSMQSSVQTPLEEKVEEPTPPVEETATPPPPAEEEEVKEPFKLWDFAPPPPADTTPPQERRSTSPNTPKSARTPKGKSPTRKGSKKAKERTSKSPKTPRKQKSVDVAPATPKRNVSNEDLAKKEGTTTPKPAKREKRKGKKRKEKKTRSKSLDDISSDESGLDERPSSDKVLLKRDKQPESPKRRSTAVDRSKVAMAAMVMDSESESDEENALEGTPVSEKVFFDASSQRMVLKGDKKPDSSRKVSMKAMVMDSDDDSDDDSENSNTEAATKNLMKKHQASSGASAPWWKKQQEAAAKKGGGARPTIGRKVQSERHFGRK